jgi:hypothetical protein
MSLKALLLRTRAIRAFVACFTRFPIANEEVALEACRVDCRIAAETSLACARAIRGSSARILSARLLFLQVCEVSPCRPTKLQQNQRTGVPTALPATVVAETSAKAAAIAKNCKSCISIYGSSSVMTLRAFIVEEVVFESLKM